jgi:hypothetical protein
MMHGIMCSFCLLDYGFLHVSSFTCFFLYMYYMCDLRSMEGREASSTQRKRKKEDLDAVPSPSLRYFIM